LETNITGQNNTYSKKIILHTIQELKTILAEAKLQTYLNEEMISIEYNMLQTITMNNLGFLEQVTTNQDKTKLHKMRISKHLPLYTPEFQLTLQLIFGPDEQPLHMMMVQCKKYYTDQLLKLLMKPKNKDCFVFFPWYVYSGLPPSQKHVILNDHQQWNATFKSVVADGIKDNEDKLNVGVD
jgi:hypothetical protein